MVKRYKNQKGAKGSALFMVICIMAILMVVAVTAMAMVSIAYTRSLQNYTASQSYITAVNTLDMITDTTHFCGTGSSSGDYGQEASDIENISKPLREVLLECMGASIKGGQKRVGNISIDAGPLAGEGIVSFAEFDDGNGNTGNILYEVLPKPSGDGKASVDPSDPSAPDCDYGEYILHNGRYYTHAKVKITVKVQTGTGDTAQVRTVSKVIDPMMSWEETSTPPPTPPGGGLFDQAVKALGKYTSAPGIKVIGGISTKEKTDVSFAGLDEITKSMFVNGNMSTVNSGWDGEVKIGADKQIAVNGTLKVENEIMFKSTFNSATDSGSKPFIYCENIQWTNSSIPSGDIDIITKTGGIYGNDNNEISGNVISGGNLELKGNNLKISGSIFVDGNVSIANSLSNAGGTIYYTGSIDTSKLNGVNAVKINPDEYNFDVKSPTTGEDGQMIIHLPDNSREYSVMTEKSVFSSCYDDSNNLIPSYEYGDSSNTKVQTDAEGNPIIDEATGLPKTVVIGPDGEEIPESDIIRITPATKGTITVPVGKTIVLDTTPTNPWWPDGGAVYEDLEIVVESGEGTVNIVQAPGNITFQGVKIWSEKVKEAVESGADLDINDIASDPEYSKIFWDVPKGSNVNIDTIGGKGNLLNAYIYSPEANVKAGNQSCGCSVKYGGSNDSVWLLGSVIANDITMGNGLGIIFIDPYASGSGTGGGGTPPSPTPTGKKKFEYNVNNGNFYFTNR